MCQNAICRLHWMGMSFFVCLFVCMNLTVVHSFSKDLSTKKHISNKTQSERQVFKGSFVK